jgi:hypothetical protein
MLIGHGDQATGASAHLIQAAPMSEPVHNSIPFCEHLIRAYSTDSRFSNSEFITTHQLHQELQLWWRGAQIVVPQNPDILQTILEDSHSSPYGGHFGINKTLKAIQRYFWWPTMKDDITKYVKACDPCQRNKVSQMQPKGQLQPLR